MEHTISVAGKELKIEYIPVASLHQATYNPRKWTKEATEKLKESIQKFGVVDPILANAAPERRGIVIGGNFRLSVFKELGITECPVVWLNIPDEERERELCLRLNKNVGAWDSDLLLANFNEGMLAALGFTSEELDEVFAIDATPEVFDLQKELEKLDINTIETKPRDIWQLGEHRLLVGDSTVAEDVLALMDGEQADLCLTDPPYLLDYLNGKKKHGEATEGFGLKRDRKYLGTDELPENFTELWMANIAKIQKPDFSVIVFENPKNLRTIWNELEKHWKYRNTIVWHLPNRVQGFSAKYKFFNKHDIALVGTGGDVALNLDPEEEPLFEEEYENALFATSGKPQWEGYEKGKKICPTDYIEYIAADEKSSGQGIIFGTKPIEILIPYLKVLTKRGDLVVEPFGGSGSTLIAAQKLGRRCRIMEKSPVYAEVIMKRFEKTFGILRQKISHE